MQATSARSRPVLTSLPLEIFFYFGGWWDAFYWIILLAVYIYKGLTLPYPTDKFAVEFTFVFLYLLIEPARLFLGSKGNKTEQAAPLLLCTVLALPMAAFYAYYLSFAVYVLKIDVLLNSVALGFLGLQALLGLVAAARFIQAAKYA